MKNWQTTILFVVVFGAIIWITVKQSSCHADKQTVKTEQPAVPSEKDDPDTLKAQIRGYLADLENLNSQIKKTREILAQDSLYVKKYLATYVCTFQMFQMADGCSANPVQFVLPVSQGFYNSVRVGSIISNGLDIGDGFTLSGKLDGWELRVVDKKIYVKK
jgi:hypothetical protein